MKKTISMVSSLIHTMTRPAAEKKSDKMILAKSLPMAVKFFVLHNFPNRSIAFSEMKFTSKGLMYVVILNDGIQVEFNKNGCWEMVDCKMGSVPATLVPPTVTSFINTYYPGISLVKMEKTDNGCEVTLSNYFTLKFNYLEYVA